MLLRSYFTLPILCMATISFAQAEKKEQDTKAIKSMCGCYEVDFAFAETFSPDKNYSFHDRHHSSGLEWVQLVEDGKDKIVLQHLLIVEDSTDKFSIVKHWRQDWLFENTDFWVFDKESKWTFKSLDKSAVKGQWTQKVFQVDDSPRYEASATWIHADGRHYWESTADSPLPRREFTTRSDYNVMKRHNRHEITATGWLHEQDNDKIVRSDKKDLLIAQEKGWNVYKKVDDKRCAAAQKWWTENQVFWAAVRAEWAEVFAKKQDLALETIIEKQPLYMHLFALKPEQKAEIKKVITKFIKTQKG